MLIRNDMHAIFEAANQSSSTARLHEPYGMHSGRLVLEIDRQGRISPSNEALRHRFVDVLIDEIRTSNKTKYHLSNA